MLIKNLFASASAGLVVTGSFLFSVKTINASTSNPRCSNFCSYKTFGSQLTQTGYVASGDINNDVKKEIVSSSFGDGKIAIFTQNNNQNELELVTTIDVNTDAGSSSNGIAQIQIADINNDNKNDIIAVDKFNDTVFGLLQTDTPFQFNIIHLINYSGGTAINGLNVGDFDGDHKTDIVITDRDNAYIYKNNNGVFSKTNTFHYVTNASNSYGEPIIADVNGDNLPDLIVADGYAKKLYIWQSPSMVGMELNGPPNSPDNISVGDLDGDGINDIASAGRGTSNLRVYWGGTFTSTDITVQGQNLNMWDTVIGKTDSTNKQILIATNEQSATLNMITFSSRTEFTQESVPGSIIPGQVILDDVNNDGFNDVIYGLAGSSASAPITVHYNINVVKYPDLQPSNIVVSNSSLPTIIPQKDISVDISNIDLGDAGSFVVRFLLPKTTIAYKEVVVNNLGANQMTTIHVSFSSRELLNAKAITISVDPNNQVVESNEGNNVIAKTF